MSDIGGGGFQSPPASGGPDPGGYVASAVTFDGIVELSTRSLTSTDNGLFSFSFWINADLSGSQELFAFNNEDSYFGINAGIAGPFVSGGGNNIHGSLAVIPNLEWHHVMGSIQTDLPSAPSFVFVASSSDGLKLAAAFVYDSGSTGDYVYTSGDSGATWTKQTGSGALTWSQLISSYDGVNLAGVAADGNVYTSTDSGITWTPNAVGAGNIQHIAGSSNGSKLVAASGSGFLYTSTDSGATWTPRGTSHLWISLASSADGANLVAATSDGLIFTSTDSGLTWGAQTSPSATLWAVASSDDGSKLVVVDLSGVIFTSVNSGAAWTDRTPTGTFVWQSVACSADGLTIIVGENTTGHVYTSENQGADWTFHTNTVGTWYSMACSTDGQQIIIAGNTNGGVVITSPDGFATLYLRSIVSCKVWAMYIDDIPATLTAEDTSPSFTVVSNGKGFRIGNWNGDTYTGDVADLRIMPGIGLHYGRLIPLATRRLFIDNAHLPVDPAVATAALGAAGAILFSGDAAAFPTNHGTGGAFFLAKQSTSGAVPQTGPGAVPLTGAVIGQAVVYVMHTSTDITTDFETTISVTDEIQQTGAGDYIGNTLKVAVETGLLTDAATHP